jgi:hypothetical protein
VVKRQVVLPGGGAEVCHEKNNHRER